MTTTRETADHAELAACPFCGLTDSADNATQEAGVSVRPFRSPAGGTACRVECACGASGPSKREDWAATEAWNRRDPQSALLSEIAALRGALEEAEKDASAWSRCAGEVVTIGEGWKERFVQAERQRDDMAAALRCIAEGNLGDASWQANYETIKQVARNAIANQGADQ